MRWQINKVTGKDAFFGGIMYGEQGRFDDIEEALIDAYGVTFDDAVHNVDELPCQVWVHQIEVLISFERGYEAGTELRQLGIKKLEQMYKVHIWLQNRHKLLEESGEIENNYEH